MSTERLEMLKEALQGAIKIEASLDMTDWANLRGPSSDWEDYDFKTDHRMTTEEAHACGTVCCIAGWAGTHPGLQDEGLALVVGYGHYRLELELYEDSTVIIRDAAGFDSPTLQSFFGLEAYQADALFSATNYVPGFHASAYGRKIQGLRGDKPISLELAVVMIDKILKEE